MHICTQNRRQEFFEAVWSLINWDVVTFNFTSALDGILPLSPQAIEAATKAGIPSLTGLEGATAGQAAAAATAGGEGPAAAAGKRTSTGSAGGAAAGGAGSGSGGKKRGRQPSGAGAGAGEALEDLAAEEEQGATA